MGSFGGRLQREREMRGISLDEIAEATKIGTRSLHALETEDFEKLPGGIFNKGFVRAYAKFLGIDEEQAVSDYMAAIGENRDEGEEQSVDTLKAVAAAKQAAAEAEGQQAGSGSGALGVVVVALLLIVAAGVGGWQYYLRSRANSEASEAPRSVPPAAVPPAATTPAPARAAVATSIPAAAKPDSKNALKLPPAPPSATKPAAAAATQGPSFELLIRAKEDSWMSIVADGKEVMSGTLKAETERSVRARERVVLKIGNAGGVEISHNGKAMAPLGVPGQSRTVTFTSGGLQQ